DRVTVFRDGKLAGAANVADIDQNWLVQNMVGRGFDFERTPPSSDPKPTMLTVEGLSSPGVLSDISFEVAAGEILGLAGLVGAGRSEVGRALVGILPVSTGKIVLDGKEARFSNPRAANRAGLIYVTEDRKA